MASRVSQAAGGTTGTANKPIRASIHEWQPVLAGLLQEAGGVLPQSAPLRDRGLLTIPAIILGSHKEIVCMYHFVQQDCFYVSHWPELCRARKGMSLKCRRM